MKHFHNHCSIFNIYSCRDYADGPCGIPVRWVKAALMDIFILKMDKEICNVKLVIFSLFGFFRAIIFTFRFALMNLLLSAERLWLSFSKVYSLRHSSQSCHFHFPEIPLYLLDPTAQCLDSINDTPPYMPPHLCMHAAHMSGFCMCARARGGGGGHLVRGELRGPAVKEEAFKQHAEPPLWRMSNHINS